MGLTLNVADLEGINIRNTIGDYTLDKAGSLVESSDENGVVSFIWDVLSGVGGFLWKAAVSLIGGGLRFAATQIWSLFVNTVQFVNNFDFGATDSQLDNLAQSQWVTVAGQLGGIVGQTIGWLVCGVAPGLITLKFNRAAGIAVLREVGEEALDELSAATFALTQTILRGFVRSAFISVFKGVRRWLRRPGNPFYALLPNSLKQAWEEGKSWRISEQVEEKIESIQNPIWETFTEEVVEEAGDACIEAGYVAAQGLDDYAARQRQRINQQVVEVIPNREYPNEKFLLAGPEDELRHTIPAALAHYEVLDQRDVGIVSAWDPSELFVRAMPLELYARIEWRSDRGNEGPRPGYQISSLDRIKIDNYGLIRQAAGGDNGYLWGRWKAVARMSDGHTITSYAASEAEAENRVRALSNLSTADILTIDAVHELKEDRRLAIQGMQKETERVYPHRIIITNRKYFETPQPGSKASKRGYYVPLTAKLSISSPVAPPDWNEQIQALLRGPVLT